jgi:DDE superfamily endonuclease
MGGGLRKGLGLAGIMPHTTVWAPDTRPLPPKPWSGCGRPPKLIRRDDNHHPVSIKALARGLPQRAWRTIKWREGTAERLTRFALIACDSLKKSDLLASCRAAPQAGAPIRTRDRRCARRRARSGRPPKFEGQLFAAGQCSR